jgi:hypothetical protein
MRQEPVLILSPFLGEYVGGFGGGAVAHERRGVSQAQGSPARGKGINRDTANRLPLRDHPRGEQPNSQQPSRANKPSLRDRGQYIIKGIYLYTHRNPLRRGAPRGLAVAGVQGSQCLSHCRRAAADDFIQGDQLLFPAPTACCGLPSVDAPGLGAITARSSANKRPALAPLSWARPALLHTT